MDAEMSVTAGRQGVTAEARDGQAPPRHVAIIMDGNGRWAAQHGLPRGEGHRRGVEAVRQTVQAAIDIGIRYLTLFSFSSENWSRPRQEVDFLFDLFRHYIKRDVARLHAKGARVSVIGRRDRLPADILAMIEETEKLTAANSGLELIFAFNYGARDEIARAARAIARDVKSGAVDPETIDETTITERLDTRSIPDPDLVIRTSGEFRLSNFLLWQSAYAELVFLPVYWPEFGADHLRSAVSQFGARSRRYGGSEPEAAK
jgi:undecaprenyl diphosphate synthase